MTTVNVTEARANLYKLIDEASASHKPVVITGMHGSTLAHMRRCLTLQTLCGR
ncbi:hypothetical protein NIG5292_02701 [Nereida ignava]|uniref:Antitoxin n=1 Tax=Nereida ignava TaxID=282199 RepID=A0A0U1NPL4_9RHOB|nr:type II toxin-antitoxin system Phd/YefM family antitoxin [Nereida ignava]CRK76636.1 hypothetical protein NIG5292_02701 [Nereida ignava]SFJ38803.1 Antitoxin Phd_YefM, type II toxin-antitoxin system [Nereida ignava DSM 16309]